MADQVGLQASAERLASAYDVALLDLDGVVYIGSQAVPDAPSHLAEATAAGMRLAFVTNNASRPPRDVAAHLQELGIPADPQDVVTSAQAAARLVAARVPSGSKVFVIGGTGLEEALRDEGLVAVDRIADDPVAVVSGYHPELPWWTVVEGAILVKRGLCWVASNTDRTVPTRYGPGPGNGVLVQAVADFAEVAPTVAGKPEPPLFQETLRRVGAERPLVVGDRLDTDIEGARRAGLDSLLVLTGVTGLDELVAAAPGARPTFLSATLAGLSMPHPAPRRTGAGYAAGGWEARVTDGTVSVEGEGEPDDWWRAVAACSWTWLDRTGQAVRTSGLAVPGA